jgi:hypothetical protein
MALGGSGAGDRWEEQLVSLISEYQKYNLERDALSLISVIPKS